MENVIKIKKVNANNLSLLVKKMLMMDSQLFISIDKDSIFSNIYTSTQDIVKLYKAPISDVFEIEEVLENQIDLSFFAGKKIQDVLSNLNSSEISMDIYYIKYQEKYLADKIILKDSKLTIEVLCQDPSFGFTSMTEKQINTVLNTKLKVFEFTINKETLSKVLNLFSLDTDEIFEITTDKHGVNIKTRSVLLNISDVYKKKLDTKIITFKRLLDKVDKEDHNLIVCEDKIIFESLTDNTKTILNLASN
jgi:hypothetical protein